MSQSVVDALDRFFVNVSICVLLDKNPVTTLKFDGVVKVLLDEVEKQSPEYKVQVARYLEELASRILKKETSQNACQEECAWCHLGKEAHITKAGVSGIWCPPPNAEHLFAPF